MFVYQPVEWLDSAFGILASCLLGGREETGKENMQEGEGMNMEYKRACEVP